jgi:hypothetical protein
VNGTILMAALALAAPTDDLAVPATRTAPSVFQAALQGEEAVLRGQSPAFAEPMYAAPTPYTTFFQSPTYAPTPGTPGMMGTQPAPYYGDPLTSDPWLGGAPGYGGGGMANPYGGGAYGAGAQGYTFGLNGPQPYRFGWTARHDVTYISSVNTNVGGDFGVLGYDWEKELTVPWYNWVFSIAPQYNLRVYDGPQVPRPTAGIVGSPVAAAPELPGNVHRFGLGLKLATPTIGNWTFEGGFNPALTTDFGTSIDSESWLFDAHAVAYWRWNPQWMWAIGAAYWDRAEDIVVPYAGAVWTPNDYVELRLLFPKPRISFFLGTPGGIPTWFYVQGEYHVEAYYLDIEGPRRNAAGGLVNVGDARVQLEDWRVVGGFYGEGQWVTAFIEAGAVLGRDVSYGGQIRGFSPDNAFILRMGLRY